MIDHMAEPVDGSELSQAYAKALELNEKHAAVVDRVIRLVPAYIVEGCVKSILGAESADMVNWARENLRSEIVQSLPNWQGREALVAWVWTVTSVFVKNALRKTGKKASASNQAGAIDLPRDPFESPTDARACREACHEDRTDLGQACTEAHNLKEEYADAVDRLVEFVSPKVKDVVGSTLDAQGVSEAIAHVRRKMVKSLPNWRGPAALVIWVDRVTDHFVKDELRKRARQAAVSIQTGSPGSLPQAPAEYPTDAQVYREALRAVLGDTKNPLETLVYLAKKILEDKTADIEAYFDPGLPDHQSLTLRAYAARLKDRCCAHKLPNISAKDWNEWFLPLEEVLATPPGDVLLKRCPQEAVDHCVTGAHKRFISLMNKRAGNVLQKAASVYPPHVAITYCWTMVLHKSVEHLYLESHEKLCGHLKKIAKRTTSAIPTMTRVQRKEAWSPLIHNLRWVEAGTKGQSVGTLPLSHWLTGADARAKQAELAGWRDTAHAQVVYGLRKKEIGLVFAYASGMLAGFAGKRHQQRSTTGRKNR